MHTWTPAGALLCAALFGLAQDPAPTPAQDPAQDPPQEAAPDPAPPTGGLVRVAPAAPAPEPPLVTSFDELAWAQRLREPDLDLRERWFDALVTLASLEDGVSALIWLGQASRDARDPELAWTARMVLRAVEDGRTRDAWPTLPGTLGLEFAPHPAILSEHMDQLFADDEGARRQVCITSGPEGCQVIVEGGAGDGAPRTVYRGESLSHILAEHPEVERELGQSPYGPGRGVGTPPEPDPVAGEVDVEPTAPPAPHRVLGVFVQDVPAALRTQLALEPDVGAHVLAVQPGSYAFALVVGPHSVIVELNGRTIDSQESITDILSTREPEDELRLTWYDAYGELRKETWRAVD